nr:MAG: hypothetical protein [Lokiarchaeota virus Fenrir Meg22_1012]URC17179.1 MAG: hypothetical protein [Lokiarchaeota virus Fenrir Meg22_1214]
MKPEISIDQFFSQNANLNVEAVGTAKFNDPQTCIIVVTKTNFKTKVMQNG